MLVHLTTLESSMTGYKKFSDVTSFSRGVDDSEVKTLICDFFLSCFERGDVEKVLSLVLKKVRIGGTVVINDFDFQELFSKSQQLEKPLDSLNNILASKTKMVKSFLDLEGIKDHIVQIGPGFKSQEEHFNNGTFTIKIVRKS